MARLYVADGVPEDFKAVADEVARAAEQIERRGRYVLDHFSDLGLCDARVARFFDDLRRELFAAARKVLNVIGEIDEPLGFDYDLELGGLIVEHGGRQVLVEFLLRGWNYTCDDSVGDVYDAEGFEIVVYVEVPSREFFEAYGIDWAGQ